MATSLAEITNMIPDPLMRKAMNFSTPVIRLCNVGTLSAVLTITSAEQTIACPGLNVGDFVEVNKPTAQAGLGIVGARVTAKDTLGITFMNTTVGSITPTASEIYKVLHVAMNAV